VPQLPEGQSLSTSRSCVSSYPTRAAEGLLWVWPDASPAALVESAAEGAWPGLAHEIDELGEGAFSRALGSHKWYARCVYVSV
jgi:phenylpropionate dioxygenase-like ring-hydroxylating dioxygenase large terminal subunit